MSLRSKTLLIIGITHLGLIALLYASSRSILLASYVRLENESVQRNVQRALAALDNEVAVFRQNGEDLAFRDETYAYLSEHDDAFTAEYFSSGAMTSRRLNFALVLDTRGRQLYTRALNWQDGSTSQLPVGLEQYLPPQGALGNPLDPSEHISGFLLLPDGPWLITVLPVLNSQEQGPVRGTLVLGRRLDRSELQRLSEFTQLALELYAYNTPLSPQDVVSARRHLTGDHDQVVVPVDESVVAGYGLLLDVYGNPGVIVQVTLPRDIYEQGRANIWYIMLALVSSGVVFSIMVLVLLEQTVLSRLSQLSASVRRIAQSGDPGRRVAVAGGDELAQLGQAVNSMLDALHLSRQQIQAGEERLRTVVANAPVILFALDHKGRITLLEGQALGELNPAQYVGRPAQELFGDAPSVIGDVQRSLEGETLISVVEWDGKVFETRYIPLLAPGSGSEIGGVIGVATDITERERAESAEHEQRMIAEALRDTAAALTGTLDLNEVLERILTNVGHVVPHDAANIMLIEDGRASVVRSLGYEERGLQSWIETLSFPLGRNPRLQHVVTANRSDVIQDTHRATGWLGFPEQHWVQSSISVPITLDGQVTGLLNLDSATTGFFTEKQAEWLQTFADQAGLALQNARFYEAERHERRLAQTLRKTAEALASSIQLEDTLNLIIEQLGQVVRYNRAAIMLVEEDLLSVAGAGGFPDDESIFDMAYRYNEIPLFRQALDSDNMIVVCDPQQTASQNVLPGLEASVRTWIGAALTAHDVVIGFLSVSSEEPEAYSQRDVEAVAAFAQQAALAIENARILTELEASLADLREAQTHLVRTTRLSAAGEIAAGVAHQINNPLTTVIAEAHLLTQMLDPSDPNYESAEQISEAGTRAATVVRRLLDLTRTHPYAMDPLDINESLESSIAVIRAQIGSHISRFDVLLKPDLPPIKASAQHLEDIWINLLLNARDAVSEGRGSLIRVTSGLTATGDAIKVTVQDNGAGIAPEKLRHIFEPFFTTKDYGTGLGLSICHEVVTRHGGHIQVDSVEGQGTTFTITLPILLGAA